jgi:hypothetical protein
MTKRSGKSKQPLCRLCRKRPPWRYKNCPPDICKQCYHKHVWEDRPAARKERAEAAAAGTSEGEHDPDDGLEVVLRYDGYSGTYTEIGRFPRER